MTEDQILREHVLELLEWWPCSPDFEKATADIPIELRGFKPISLPYTIWRLAEHMRIAQWDILQFCINPQHISPEFPNGYWPHEDTPPKLESWDHSLTAFRADLKAMMNLVADPKTNLFRPIGTR